MSWTSTTRWLAELGLTQTNEADRQGILVANLAAAVIAVSSVAFAVIYALHQQPSLRILVVCNVLLAAAAMMTPLLHRFGKITSALWEFTICAVALSIVSVQIGGNSGALFNLLGVTPVAFAILGLQHWKLVASLGLLSAIIIVVGVAVFPDPRPGVYHDESFLLLITTSTIFTVTLLMFATMHYALSLAREAQMRLSNLMLSIMPAEIVEKLHSDDHAATVKKFDMATVLLIDIIQFVRLSNEIGPERTVALLDEFFSALDAASARFGVEKIKTIGDAYLAAAGVPSAHPNGVEAAAAFGFTAFDIADHVGRTHGVALGLRIGMASGAVTAGVLGRTRYAYDIWGAPVNLAARLEAIGEAGCIVTTREVKTALEGKFAFEEGELADIKGFGNTETWRMVQRRER
ncbi:adenylate/guanylate cyclase domain-containing protein [Ensifer sp. MJa1]|uniref:adenylate/guanylate cyclase domain-containing protein n=1 Tax=Ensifer sp. MJa1 TaxID=2919888 RepID=UPI00300B75F1